MFWYDSIIVRYPGNRLYLDEIMVNEMTAQIFCDILKQYLNTQQSEDFVSDS